MRTHQKFDRTGIHGDRPIQALKGLSPVSMESLTTSVKVARTIDKKDKALRSIARECRLWHKKHNAKTPVRVYSHLISQQDGLTNDKLIIAIG